MPLVLRYNWNETYRTDERQNILEQFFRNSPVLPNRTVLNLLSGHIEIALHVDNEKRFVCYEVGKLGMVWICAKCDHTVMFDSLEEYERDAGVYYMGHEPTHEQE